MRKIVALLWQWRHLVFLIFFSLMATFFLDLTMTIVRKWIDGEPVGISQAIIGPVGLGIGGYGLLRFVYRHDKKTGRVKRNVKWLE
ncbi:hypothetical protein H1S01_06765 [Heliobacterium chlorum]|uniref:Uncharacterized protein n=1 Tax=Heliobacterium chlorum TaxID=2698 RepID=A0ABR7T2K6_HELCL|nr:hypothetical protein [Heliobacterium chlorum]MBC9784210.1 hypothetical protein [Heliobacterium chlorum]